MLVCAACLLTLAAGSFWRKEKTWERLEKETTREAMELGKELRGMTKYKLITLLRDWVYGEEAEVMKKGQEMGERACASSMRKERQ